MKAAPDRVPQGIAMYPCLSAGDFLGKVVRRHACSGIVLTETRHSPGARLPRHCHEHAYFCLIRRGTYREEYGGRQRLCSPRMVAFHPPGEIHAEHIDAEEVWSFNIEISPSWTGRFPGATLPLDQPFESSVASILCLASRVFDEFKHFDASSPLIVEGLTLELLGTCDRQARGETVVPRWLRHVSDRIREHCTESWDLGKIAAEAGVHPGYLATAFRRHFGCTVGEFVRRERIALACRDLARADVSLADIATLAGFADQSHFTRTFRRQIGMTPAAYRKMRHRDSKRSKS
jgi:AraC family transcriptional regulator